MRTLYKILSVFAALAAIRRGRFGRYMIRRSAMRGVSRATRRIRF